MRWLLVANLLVAGCFLRRDRHELAHLAAVLELHHARHLGEQGVVFATAHVDARLDAGAALPHDDGAARNQLASERFHAQPLCIRVAAIPRATSVSYTH